jgi:hypothetical protein
MYMLSTLYRLRARLGLAATETADDFRLIAALEAASASIERAAGRRFTPRRAALQHDYTSSLELLLDDDLLELTAITNGDGNAIPLEDVIPVPDEAPWGLLRLTGGSAFTWSASPIQAITVTGLWGWFDRPASMWRSSGDTVQDNPLSASATLLTVADADAADTAQEMPRFQIGHLLRIEDEYLRVLGVNTTSNVLIVQRGVNGTTAASHALNTPIDTYQPPAEIESFCLRRAAWLYREADNIALDAPDDLADALGALRRARVKV